MIGSFKKSVLVAALGMSANIVWANDCGWKKLNSSEQKDLMSGATVMRNRTDADGVRSHIDQWAFSANSSLIESVANFYDISEYKKAGDVADITLAEGQVLSNNPVIYNVIPLSDNAFGKLYQPFSFSSTVRPDGDGYRIVVNYLSSPGLIKHVLNDVCLSKVNGKVLIGFLSTVTDNPKLPVNGTLFGWLTRKVLWKKVFKGDVERVSQKGSPIRIENLRKALLIAPKQ